MSIKALICDDNVECSEITAKYFTRYCDDRNINYSYDCFNNAKDSLESASKYDIAFLDIEIDNVSGLEIAEHLKAKNKNVIIFFITEYEKYIDDAMNLFALRFLKKPLDYSRFYSGLDKAIELINNDIVEFYIKDTNKVKKIKSDEVIYIETMDHKVKVVTTEKIYYSNDLIDIWETKLNHLSFYRTHKSFILNLNYIDEYKRNEVKLTNGEIIPIAYRNQTIFRKYFHSYLKRRK